MNSLLRAILPLTVLLLLALGRLCLSPESAVFLEFEQAFQDPTWSHPLGYGEGGLELARYAASATLRVLGLALGVVAFSLSFGTLIGAWAGMNGGRLERTLLQLCDAVQSFPTFLFAVVVFASVEEATRLHLALVFCITGWAPFARIATVRAREIVKLPYAEACLSLGGSRFRLLLGHIIPNLMAAISIQIGTSMAGIVLGESALSFIGLSPADGVALGNLLEQGVATMLRAPHILAAGAICIAALSGSLQWFSEGLRRNLQR